MNDLWKRALVSRLNGAAKARLGVGWKRSYRQSILYRTLERIVGILLVVVIPGLLWYLFNRALTTGLHWEELCLYNLFVLQIGAWLEAGFWGNYGQGAAAHRLLIAPVGKVFWWQHAWRDHCWQVALVCFLLLITAIAVIYSGQRVAGTVAGLAIVAWLLNDLLLIVAISWLLPSFPGKLRSFAFLLGMSWVPLGLFHSQPLWLAPFHALGHWCYYLCPLAWPIAWLRHDVPLMIGAGLVTLGLVVAARLNYLRLQRTSEIAPCFDAPMISAEGVEEFLSDLDEEEAEELQEQGFPVTSKDHVPPAVPSLPSVSLAAQLRTSLDSVPAISEKKRFWHRVWLERLKPSQRRLLAWFVPWEQGWHLAGCLEFISVLILASLVFLFEWDARIPKVAGIGTFLLTAFTYFRLRHRGPTTKPLCRRTPIGPNAQASNLALYPIKLPEVWQIHFWRMVVRCAAAFPLFVALSLLVVWLQAWDRPFSKSNDLWPWGLQPSCARFLNSLRSLIWLKVSVGALGFIVVTSRASFSTQIAHVAPKRWIFPLYAFLVHSAMLLGLLSFLGFATVGSWLAIAGTLAGIGIVSTLLGNFILWRARRGKKDWACSIY